MTTQNNPQLLDAQIVDVTFGRNVRVVQPVNLYDCSIGDECFIGPFVEIQGNVVIGTRSRIQSHSFVCSLVTIGDDCFIGHGVMFINDKFSSEGPNYNSDCWQACSLGNKVSIGSNSTILPVSICDRVIIGAGSVVTKDITQAGIYAGNPAKFLRPIADENNQ